jgi:hypothetical protein
MSRPGDLLRTMFSMPLAYPSTLDHRNAASFVEELWSPALRTLRIIRRQKQRLIQQRIRLRSERSRTFLSQAGPRVWIVAFQAEHHLISMVEPVLIRRRRPSRIALARNGYASNRLAHMPPGEGRRLVPRALRGAHRPAGDRGGDGRFGGEGMGVGMPVHDVCRRYCRIRD